MLEVKNLGVKFGNVTIVKDVSFKVEERQWLMIVGPNGAGKSTIVSAISGGIAYSGDILFNGQDITKIKSVEKAKNIGILTQKHHVGYSFSVEEVVRLGRYAYEPGIFSAGSDENRLKVDKALAITGMEPFRHQSVLTLSGGEQQRAFLAQLFAQDPKLLILDEPTNHLDLVYQKQVFELIRDWISKTGCSVVSVVHDLSLAKAFGTDALLIHQGEIRSAGKINEVLTRDNLQAVYSMDVYQWMDTMLEQWRD